MTISQFEGIMDRFTDFTAENVKQVLNTIDINVLYSKIKEMSVSLFVQINVDLQITLPGH